jgi:hypothetical protein
MMAFRYVVAAGPEQTAQVGASLGSGQGLLLFCISSRQGDRCSTQLTDPLVLKKQLLCKCWDVAAFRLNLFACG